MYKLKIWFGVQKAKRLWKNSKNDNTRYSLQLRFDYILKKVISIMKSLKIEIEVKGYENLGTTGPCILYGNHQDNFDPLALIYALKAQTEAKDDMNKIATFIAKQSLQYHSYTRYPLNCIDTFFLDRNDIKKSLETYDAFGKFVKNNKTYGIIFPEGTRNREGTISEFKPGAFKVVKKEMIPIVPFTINNSVGAFDNKRKDVLKIEVIFHKKISAHSFDTQNTIALAERIQKIVESSFVKPFYDFKEDVEEQDEENSKAAIRYKKKMQKKETKQIKKEYKDQQREKRILENQKKQEEKYEKSIRKKESKSKNK